MYGVQWNRLTSGARSWESTGSKVLGRMFCCRVEYDSREAKLVITVIVLCNWFG